MGSISMPRPKRQKPPHPLRRPIAAATLEMPPEGKGEPLTLTAQIALLRAWIDQGVTWDKSSPSNNFTMTLSPTFGGTTSQRQRAEIS